MSINEIINCNAFITNPETIKPSDKTDFSTQNSETNIYGHGYDIIEMEINLFGIKINHIVISLF